MSGELEYEIAVRLGLSLRQRTDVGVRSRARLQKMVGFGGDVTAIEAGEIEGFICARTCIREVLQAVQL